MKNHFSINSFFYGLAGIHDNDPDSPNEVLAPTG
jgi:hypothetical protein